MRELLSYDYPNPAGSWLHIGTGNHSITEIAITGTRGALVYKSKPVQETIEIPVSSFSEGIYFIKLVTDHGTVHRKVMVSRD